MGNIVELVCMNVRFITSQLIGAAAYAARSVSLPDSFACEAIDPWLHPNSDCGVRNEASSLQPCSNHSVCLPALTRLG